MSLAAYERSPKTKQRRREASLYGAQKYDQLGDPEGGLGYLDRSVPGWQFPRSFEQSEAYVNDKGRRVL